MKKYIMILMMAFGTAVAHEMTPTYPELEASHVTGIYKTTMEMFNKRKDVEWYEIGVFDNEWKPIPFVSSYKIIQLQYLGHVKFDIYIRADDKARATYVCSKSKLRREDSTKTAVSSRICSKFK
jgi:hypothetical protein